MAETTQRRAVEPDARQVIDLGDGRALRLYWRGVWRFEHPCIAGDGEPVTAAPELNEATHAVVWTDSDDPDVAATVTVTPSLSCPACGTHGHVVRGVWTDAD